MAKVFLKDFDSDVFASVTGTVALGASFEVPNTCDKVALSVPTLAATTFGLYSTLSGSSRVIPYDIDGTSYPAASFTGNKELKFIVTPGSHLVMSAGSGTAAIKFWR